MRLLADESVDAPIVAELRIAGHEVAFIAEDSPGVRDEVVLARAWSEAIVLLTADKDFGELVYRQRLPHAGVLLLRFAGLDEATKCNIVDKAIAEHADSLPASFSVLTAESLRIRRDPIA